ALAALLAPGAASAAVPSSLVLSTTEAASVAAGILTTGVLPAAAAALSRGVLQAMFLTKIKLTAIVVLIIGLAGAGTGLLLDSAHAGPSPTPLSAPPDEKKDEKGRRK